MQRLSEVPSPKILEMLEAVVRDFNSGRTRDGAMVSYDVEQAFEALAQNDVSDEAVAPPRDDAVSAPGAYPAPDAHFSVMQRFRTFISKF